MDVWLCAAMCGDAWWCMYCGVCMAVYVRGCMYGDLCVEVYVVRCVYGDVYMVMCIVMYGCRRIMVMHVWLRMYGDVFAVLSSW